MHASFVGGLVMEIIGLLFLFVCFLAFFKVFALVFKAGLFVLTIPLQIVGAIISVFFLTLFLPLAIVGGIVATIFAPLLIIKPLLPLLLIGAGVYLLLKN
jgi:hypothetical protein